MKIKKNQKGLLEIGGPFVSPAFWISRNVFRRKNQGCKTAEQPDIVENYRFFENFLTDFYESQGGY